MLKEELSCKVSLFNLKCFQIFNIKKKKTLLEFKTLFCVEVQEDKKTSTSSTQAIVVFYDLLFSFWLRHQSHMAFINKEDEEVR